MATIEYELSKRELILTGTLRKLGRTRTLIGIGLIFLAGAFLLFFGESYRVLGWFLVAYVIVFPILVARATQQQINANPAFTSRTTLTFTETGITSVVNGIRSDRPWDSLQSWSHSNKYFFLHVDKLGTAITIPKRAFTESQLDLFFDELSHITGDLVPSTNET